MLVDSNGGRAHNSVCQTYYTVLKLGKKLQRYLGYTCPTDCDWDS